MYASTQACTDNKNDFSVFSSDPNSIFFTGEITRESMSSLVKELKDCESIILNLFEEAKESQKPLSSKFKKHFNSSEITLKPIRLTISSYGGSVYAALFAVDIIKSLQVPVHTVVCGYCASAATLLSLAGKKRLISGYSNMLIHEIRAGYWGKRTQVNDEHENITKLSDLLIDYYTKHTKLNRQQLEEILKRDKNWNANECLQNGLVDEII